MASIEHEAKGSLEISALTSARFLQNQKKRKKVFARSIREYFSACS
jgi:hypothetical protein